mgnify:CR=1 FL=1
MGGETFSPGNGGGCRPDRPKGGLAEGHDRHVAKDLVLEPRWVGFDAPREFLIGYGLDHSENFRNLPFIGSLKAPE